MKRSPQQQTWFDLALPTPAVIGKEKRQAARRRKKQADQQRARRSSFPSAVSSSAKMATRIIARTVACDPDNVKPEMPLNAVGADDLDVAEIIFLCEKELGLPEDSLWARVAARPARLTPADLAEWLSQPSSPPKPVQENLPLFPG